MTSPFDFLERDIKLSNRRKGDDRQEFLSERIARVLRVLKYQGNDIPECVSKSYSEIIARFKLDDVSFEDSFTVASQLLVDALATERDSLAITLIQDFVNDHCFSEESI
jgi:hypothetical protein